MNRLLGVLASLCLLVQPVVVRLHLALEDHIHGPAWAMPGADAHDQEHGHAHSHPHPHPHPAGQDEDPIDSGDGGGGSHPAHPVDDHLGTQQSQHRAPPSPDLQPPALPPTSDHGQSAALPSAPVSQCARRIPERPPPRGPVQPRAPPAAV